MKDHEIVKEVREKYGKAALSQNRDCGCCCGSSAEGISKTVGYSEEDLNSIPQESNLGLGCGNPLGMTEIQEGETVLDLGSGAGIDAFLASKRVGPKGKVIGVDMTPEMIQRARKNAEMSEFKNVEFRLGEIENLPVERGTVDLIISNCVINLSVNKKRVFQEAFRVLKKGGRISISDIVILQDLPQKLMSSISAYTGCIAGAIKKDQYLLLIQEAGFGDIKILEESALPLDLWLNDPIGESFMSELNISNGEGEMLISSIASIKVKAVKP